MFKRLFVLLLLVAATVSATPPAHASTVSIDRLYCRSTAPSYAQCDADVSGDGTGIYTYYWKIEQPGLTWYDTTTWNSLYFDCLPYLTVWVTLTVVDSDGTSASRGSMFRCMGE